MYFQTKRERQAVAMALSQIKTIVNRLGRELSEFSEKEVRGTQLSVDLAAALLRSISEYEEADEQGAVP